MHWTTYRHIPGDAPEKPTRPQARQANSSPNAARTTLQDYITQRPRCRSTVNSLSRTLSSPSPLS